MDNRIHTFLCLNDGAYALQTEEETQVYGEDYLLQDGQLTKVCSDNESAVLLGEAMPHLFTVDIKNYNPTGTIGRRPSVRWAGYNALKRAAGKIFSCRKIIITCAGRRRNSVPNPG